MSDLKANFGQRLKQLRQEKGFTQEKLADALDITVESVSNIERGIYGPKFDNLQKIAHILDVEVKELFEF